MPALTEFLDSTRVHLAISLHDPFPAEREKLMPAQKAFDIRKVVEVLRKYDFSGQRRVSFEYIMFDRVNDSKKYADEVIRLLEGLNCRVNLIRFHSIPDSPLRPSPLSIMEKFESRLNAHGLVSTIRASRGEDIFAACGLLSGNREK
jgi:23S rRNA (adenine2503-C2)-methyltransferase